MNVRKPGTLCNGRSHPGNAQLHGKNTTRWPSSMRNLSRSRAWIAIPPYGGGDGAMSRMGRTPCAPPHALRAPAVE